MNIPELSFTEFAAKYCERQLYTPLELKARLESQRNVYKPVGWFMLECTMLDSSHLGELTILPYGGTAKFQEVPLTPISLRGLASDMSIVTAILKADALA